MSDRLLSRKSRGRSKVEKATARTIAKAVQTIPVDTEETPRHSKEAAIVKRALEHVQFESTDMVHTRT